MSRPKSNPIKKSARADGGVALGKLDDYIGFHLRLAQNASFRAFQRETGQSDLSPGWFALLSLIADNPGITPMALSRASGRDKSTLTPLLRTMIRDGYVDRRSVATDRRSYALSLTGKGADRLGELAMHAAEHDRRLDAIAGEHKSALIDLLRRIATTMD